MSIAKTDRILDAQTPLSDLKFVSFDVETTGLSPVVARLVELSGVKFSLTGPDVSFFSSLIDPEIAIPEEVTAVHGITQDMVKGAPPFSQVIPQFMEWLGGNDTVMVAHNAPFDLGFMKVALMKLGLSLPKNNVVDSLTLSRRLLSDAPNHQLQTLVRHLELEDGSYHRALADSHHVKNLFRRLITTEPVLATWGALAELGCVLSPEGDEEYELSPSSEVLDLMQSIKEAISGDEFLSLVYGAYHTRSRIVKPLALLQNRGRYYLNAYCRQVEEERTFRLDRITSVKIVKS